MRDLTHTQKQPGHFSENHCIFFRFLKKGRCASHSFNPLWVILESLSEFILISFSNSFHVHKQHNRIFFFRISDCAALYKAEKTCKMGGIHTIHQESAKF